MRCDGCQISGSVNPLFPRPIDFNGEYTYKLFCGECQRKTNEQLLEKLAMWEPPYDRRSLGVGA